MEKKEMNNLDQQAAKKDIDLSKAVLSDDELGEIAGGAKVDLKTLMETTVKILTK